MTAYHELTTETECVANDHESVEAHNLDDLVPEPTAPAETADGPVLADSSSAAKKGLIGAVPGRLIATLETQYVVVTALAALTAVTVAAEAAKMINAKIDLIVTALKRL